MNGNMMASTAPAPTPNPTSCQYESSGITHTKNAAATPVLKPPKERLCSSESRVGQSRTQDSLNDEVVERHLDDRDADDVGKEAIADDDLARHVEPALQRPNRENPTQESQQS
jgi:hypothetical protein